MSVTDPKFNPSGSNDIAALKEAALKYEEAINKFVPLNSRCKSIALTHLETASMFAVKAAATGE